METHMESLHLEPRGVAQLKMVMVRIITVLLLHILLLVRENCLVLNVPV